MAGTDLDKNRSDLEVRDVSSAEAMSKAETEVKAAFVMAERHPRNESKAMARLGESLKRARFAEAAFYSYPRSKKGGGKVEIYGPSINLAREIGRLWGNIRTGMTVVFDDADTRIIQCDAWDLETGYYTYAQDQFSKKIQRYDYKLKVTRYIDADERELRELTNRKAAILRRNCILELVPRDIVDQAVEDARHRLKESNGGKTLAEKIDDMLQAFNRLGIYEADVQGYAAEHFGVELHGLSEDHLVELRGVYTAIKDDAGKREEYFGKKTAPKTEEKPPTVDGQFTLEDATKGKVVDEPDSDAKKYPPVAQMRAKVQVALIARLDTAEAAESYIKISKWQATSITGLKGEDLRAAYDQEVRAHGEA